MKKNLTMLVIMLTSLVVLFTTAWVVSTNHNFVIVAGDHVYDPYSVAYCFLLVSIGVMFGNMIWAGVELWKHGESEY